jgi:ectoine hydroxylase-related dioxygenase (phytanoyl-CoA dioxygenase family)
VDVDSPAAHCIELQPGEVSLHHVRIVHGSPPNPSAQRRIGFAIRYIPTSVRQVQGEDSATLVRGVDRFRTFAHEPRPPSDQDPRAVALHREITGRNAAILYQGTAIQGFDQPAPSQPER